MTELTSRRALLAKLTGVLVRQRAVLFVSGVMLTAAAVTAAAIGLSLWANVMILPVAVKLPVLIAVGAGTLYLFGRYAVARLFSGSIDAVAVALEERNPELKGRLIAAIQFARMKDAGCYSAALIEATERQALARAQGVNFNQALSFYPVLRSGRYFATAAAAALLVVALLPGMFRYSFLVFSNPTTEIAPPLAYKVVPFPGTTEWVKYRDIEIGASIFGERLPESAVIHHRLVDGNWQETEIDLRKVRRAPMVNGDSVRIATTLRQINRSFDYYVEAGRVATPVQQVSVVDRPRVNGLKLSIFYPDYTGLAPTVIDENNGSFSAVVGSRVNLAVETNLPVARAELVFDDSSRTPLEVDGRQAETALRVDKSLGYHVRLIDGLGEENPDPIQYHITAVPDEYPSIDVLFPGVNVNLSDEMVLPLKVRIFDDYGFTSLVLKYTVVAHGQASEENVAVLHFSDRIKTEGEIAFNWDMDKLNMYPGDYTIYRFEVADNDVNSGPKVTASRQYVARIPSLEEIIAEAEGESSRRVDNTRQLLQQGEDLSERFKNMARKLKAQNRDEMKAEWQHQKEMEALAAQNQELIENIEKMAEEMDKSVEKLADNAQMSREIVEKLQQIQKLFEEVATPEMKEAQKKLMEALQKMDRNEIQKAMEQFQLSQEEMLQRLERTLALLKQMQVEQKMQAMMRQAERLLEQQNQVNQATDSSAQSALPPLAERETDLKKDLESLKKETADLRKLMDEAQMNQSEEARKFAEAVEQTDADRNMEKMSGALAQQQQQPAAAEGKQASAKLAQMLSSMQQQLAAMNSGQNEALRKMMRLAIDDANYLSQSQEELLKRAAEVTTQSDILRELAQSQQDLMTACSGLKGRIAELAKESPFVASELGQIMNQATAQMDMAMLGLGDRQGPQAIALQRDAMTNLNKVSLYLMEAMNQQNQCDKGGSCDKNMAKLQSMCNKQNQVNQETQQTCNNPSFNPASQGQQTREALQRLAG
ncbi:MAG TPA: hypothetical protein PKW75_06100, partial [candidate division Zixibacteria bacterium]|nr:hypothetical protein [candidate division Zixibacteria bacterium]